MNLDRRIGRRIAVALPVGWAVPGWSPSRGAGTAWGSCGSCTNWPAAGLRLSVAHLDHGVRGEASRADAAFVAELAGVARLAVRPGSVAADPRRALRVRRPPRPVRLADRDRPVRGAAVVAVGHTRDDQAETILHRIVRGTGPAGWPASRGRRVLATDPQITLVRPLLDVSRGEIRDYLAELGQPFREDEIQRRSRGHAARIRHDLLPKLAAEYNPKRRRCPGPARGARRGVPAARSRPTLRELEHAAIITFSEDASCSSMASCVRSPPFSGPKCCAGSGDAPAGPRRACRRGVGGGWRPWCETEEIPRVEIGAGVTMATESFFLVLRRLPAVQAVLAGLGPHRADRAGGPRLGIRPLGRRSGRGDDRPADESMRRVDRPRPVGSPLVHPRPTPGDRFEPLGMGGKSMPLADFFRGRHVPHDRRARIPLVCDQRGIIWVVGHRIADRVKVTSIPGDA